MPLFEVAILKQPTQKEIEDGAVEELVLGPKAVIAKDEQSAAIAAALSEGKPIPDMQRCTVIVRPFA
jgi:hypothetical protein